MDDIHIIDKYSILALTLIKFGEANLVNYYFKLLIKNKNTNI